MQGLDLDVFKEIPGYKAILKAVLKSQIQALVEQLAKQTGEESVLLTACVEEGTLSHLGSDFGIGFLEGHDDIKSQFLGFCLKRYQLKRQTHSLPEAQTRRRGPTGPNKRPRLNFPKTAHYQSPHQMLMTPSPNQKTTARPKQKRNPNQTTSFTPDNMYTGYDEMSVDMSGSSHTPNYFNAGMGESDSNKVTIKSEPVDIAEEDEYQKNSTDAGVKAEGNQILNDAENFLNMVEPGDSYGQTGDGGTEAGIQKHGQQTGNQSDKEEGQGHTKLKTDKTKPVWKCKLKEDAEAANHSSDLERDGSNLGNGSENESSQSEGKRKNRRKGDSTPVRCMQIKDEIENYLNLENTDRPYPCTNCPKRFKERHHLTYHLRTHSGSRPYTCEICNKAFTQTSSLNTHRKIHMNEINCGMCGRMFKKHADFSLHVCYNSEQLLADTADSSMLYTSEEQ